MTFFTVCFVIIFLATSPKAIGKWLAKIEHSYNSELKNLYGKPKYTLED